MLEYSRHCREIPKYLDALAWKTYSVVSWRNDPSLLTLFLPLVFINQFYHIILGLISLGYIIGIVKLMAFGILSIFLTIYYMDSLKLSLTSIFSQVGKYRKISEKS